MILHALSALSPSARASFYNLSYVNLPLDTDPDFDMGEVAIAIFQTNAVAAGDGQVGIFPRMARLNHGCVSAFNAVYSWRDHPGAIVVHALKDIKEGEVGSHVLAQIRMSSDEAV
jgi:hypothetical protein